MKKITKTKKIVFIIGCFIGLLVVILISVLIFLDSLIESGINGYGPEVTGTDVGIKNVGISIISGNVEVDNLHIANPTDNFKKKNAFLLNSLSVDVDNSTLFSDKIVVNHIIIDGMEINYEINSAGRSNLGIIKENIDKQLAKSKKEEKKAPEDQKNEKKEKKKIVVKKFLCKKIKLSAGSSLLKTASAEIILPDIQVNNIGKNKKANLPEVLEKIYIAVLQTTVKELRNPSGILDKLSSGKDEIINDAVQKSENLIDDTENKILNIME